MEIVLDEMLHDRGFSDIQKDNEQFWVVYRDNTDMHDKIIVYFVKNVKVCIKKIKEIEQVLDENVSLIILIYSNNITSFARQAIIQDITCPIQVFHESELQFNITKHMLVPKHEIMTKIFRNDFMSKNNYKANNLPRIFTNDPIMKYMNAQPGDLIRVTRNSETSGESIYYRLVYQASE